MVSEGEPVTLPDNCPTCEGGVTWENDFLICTNELCEARMESRLGHFFEIIDNVDLFGPKTIETLVASGLTELPAIYNMTSADLVTMGFGPKQSQNLVDQLKRSRSESVENWRFLAAFGIHHLGRGDSRRLLKTFTLEALEGITASQIQTIAGFGPVTAPKIAAQINELWPLIRQMLDFGFNLKADEAPTTAASALAGKSIVFTGTLSLSREEMQETARMVGANVQSSVSKSTDILVAGENVGAKKIEAAQAKGVQILCEAEYEALCAEPAHSVSEQGTEMGTLTFDFEL
jgi:DNA ligase (NAD+)